jgi:hypothetical protein
MATALIAARNVSLDQDRDPWAVNEDAEYHEIARTERQAPLVPHETPATPVPAITLVGDPTSAISEKVLDEGHKDPTIVVLDQPNSDERKDNAAAQ